jgi:hypothetical protein
MLFVSIACSSTRAPKEWPTSAMRDAVSAPFSGSLTFLMTFVSVDAKASPSPTRFAALRRPQSEMKVNQLGPMTLLPRHAM